MLGFHSGGSVYGSPGLGETIFRDKPLPENLGKRFESICPLDFQDIVFSRSLTASTDCAMTPRSGASGLIDRNLRRRARHEDKYGSSTLLRYPSFPTFQLAVPGDGRLACPRYFRGGSRRPATGHQAHEHCRGEASPECGFGLVGSAVTWFVDQPGLDEICELRAGILVHYLSAQHRHQQIGVFLGACHAWR